jgi:hypothetical protein
MLGRSAIALLALSVLVFGCAPDLLLERIMHSIKAVGL